MGSDGGVAATDSDESLLFFFFLAVPGGDAVITKFPKGVSAVPQISS